MRYTSFHLEKPVGENELPSLSKANDDWSEVMLLPDEDIVFTEDCPELDWRYVRNPVFRIGQRVIPPRPHPLAPYDAELLSLMKADTPLIQMEPEIMGGMPVFTGTTIPLKMLFDYLLDGKSLDDFVHDHPLVTRAVATAVLETPATLFYEDISKAIASAAMPSSRPR
jgi:uncharacterized protein (DUF433 family)